MKSIITTKDVTPLSDNIKNKLVVIRSSFFPNDMLKAKYQLVRVISGFGCNIENKEISTKILCKDVFTKENGKQQKRQYILTREDLIGEPSEQCLLDYRRKFGKIN